MKKRRLEAEYVLGVRMHVNVKDGHSVMVDQTSALKKPFGTKHNEMAEGLFRHCLKVLKPNDASEEVQRNDERIFKVAALNEIRPRDGIERMLAVQMTATQVVMVRAGRWMATLGKISQFKAYYSGYNWLTCTDAAQMAALRKHCNGGKQTATVQHVNVEDGGQAIVGNVQPGEGRT